MNSQDNLPLAKVIDPERVDWDKNNVDYRPDTPYGTRNGHSLYLDLMLPRQAPRPLPVVVWFHGGGWTSEELTRLYRPETSLLELCRMGFACASVDYTLIQETPFPAQLEDARCAIRFLRAHAAQYGLDPLHIGVWGESGGGRIVSMLGAMGHLTEFEGNGGWPEYSSRVQAVCQWYAGCNYEKSVAMDPAQANRYPAMFGREYTGNEAFFRKISVINYASREDLPPFLIMHGDADRLVPCWHSVDFYQALHQAGQDATLIVVPGQGHGFFDGDEYYQPIYRFFQRTLQSPDAR